MTLPRWVTEFCKQAQQIWLNFLWKAVDTTNKHESTNAIYFDASMTTVKVATSCYSTLTWHVVLVKINKQVSNKLENNPQNTKFISNETQK